MRALIPPVILTAGLLVAVGLPGSLAFASESIAIDKVKTGILPSGGFYGIYEVACDNESSANIASLDGKRRWCISHQEELSCFARAREAVELACATQDVVSIQGSIEAMGAGR